ncbi:hypothetical protein ASPNIDRAFT_39407 [Aspergillus niger ATCC 1015]|jgi:hypothetical protein|uniref:Uncharacterized protein n=2 Tax=Aspergillus subgen. Circumdati TaxID=2720871 RepID=A0A3F3PWV4_9EURO|nr:hypothetical protein BDQ94DRAFT_147216 [Aspergillus welwitschiae]EHA19989.1 hypothetical protein ASPNIDRAFT_39407 [Aspergillus niger ATCC 1015]RDH31338.1 hypothetical protein BDQ94DRAFT_147216 [Aspergillus welwitschiae]
MEMRAAVEELVAVGVVFRQAGSTSKKRRKQFNCSVVLLEYYNASVKKCKSFNILPLCFSTVPGALIDPNSQERVDTRPRNIYPEGWKLSRQAKLRLRVEWAELGDRVSPPRNSHPLDYQKPARYCGAGQ